VHLIVNANIFFSGRWLDVSARQCHSPCARLESLSTTFVDGAGDDDDDVSHPFARVRKTTGLSGPWTTCTRGCCDLLHSTPVRTMDGKYAWRLLTGRRIDRRQAGSILDGTCACLSVCIGFGPGKAHCVLFLERSICCRQSSVSTVLYACWLS
jgi:hypothetical protein